MALMFLIVFICKIDTGWVKAFVHKARALQAQGKFDEVTPFYLPSFLCAIYGHFHVYFQLFFFLQAVTVFKSAIQVAPKQEKVLKGIVLKISHLCNRSFLLLFENCFLCCVIIAGTLQKSLGDVIAIVSAVRPEHKVPVLQVL